MHENDIPYLGTERRSGKHLTSYPCPIHDEVQSRIQENFERGEKRMERFEEKIDTLIKGQELQALAIQSLQSTIGNGLSGDIRRTREAVEIVSTRVTQVCTNYDQKLEAHEKELSDFKWFRDWANNFKNSMIKRFLTAAFYGGLAITVFYFLEKYFQRIK